MLYQPLTPLGGSEAGANNFGTTAVQLVDPAANVGGMVLRSLTLTNAAAQRCAVYVGASAPASVNATDVLKLASSYNSASGVAMWAGSLLLPAGYGVWAIADASAIGNHAAISYDLR